jgi:hypothetical protein
MKYFYLVKFDDGIKIESVDVGDAFLNITNKSPRIEYYHKEFKNKFWSKVIPDVGGDQSKDIYSAQFNQIQLRC